MKRVFCWVIVALVVGRLGEIQAQDHDHTAAQSPYSGLEQREIKALSDEEISGLLAGEGLGMALPAELNGYPGPKHVLELAPDLSLSDSLLSDIQLIYHRMNEKAVSLGKQIVSIERQLDDAFAGAIIDQQKLEDWLSRAGELRGSLRTAHLTAHLEVSSLMTDQQRRHYQMLRGYSQHDN